MLWVGLGDIVAVKFLGLMSRVRSIVAVYISISDVMGMSHCGCLHYLA